MDITAVGIKTPNEDKKRFTIRMGRTFMGFKVYIYNKGRNED